MLGELESGEIRRIDALLTRSDETVKTLEERKKQLEEQESDDNSSEHRFLEEMVNKEEATREKLLFERAEAVRCGVQIRTLLQLIDSMRLQSMSRTVGITAPEDGSCSDVEEFYRLLSEEYPDNKIIKKRLKLSKYYEIDNIYLRTLVRSCSNPGLYIYMLRHYMGILTKKYTPRSSN